MTGGFETTLTKFFDFVNSRLHRCMPGVFDAVAKLPANASPAHVKRALADELPDFVAA